MINPLYAGLGGAAGALVLGFGIYTWGHGNGKEAERLRWESASVKVLSKANDGLAELIDELKQEAARKDAVNSDATRTITETEVRYIDRIIERPIERVVEVASDCRIDYGLVLLRNDWAAGNREPDSSSLDSSPDLSGSLLDSVSRDTGNDQSDAGRVDSPDP